jgi:hypothetical protein
MRVFTSMEYEREAKRLTQMARDLEQAAVLTAKPDRHDRRLERWMSCDTNGCHRPSTAGLRPSLSGAVEIPPAGNTTTAPPFAR